MAKNTEVVSALLAKGAKLEAANGVLCVRPLYRRCVCTCVCECVHTCAYTNIHTDQNGAVVYVYVFACACVSVCNSVQTLG